MLESPDSRSHQALNVIWQGGGRSVHIGADVVVKIVSVRGQMVTFGITRPEGVPVRVK